MIDAEMYGMMPRAKTERRRSAPPEKRSRKPKTPPLHRLEELGERDRVDARRRDVRSEAIDGEQREREEHALAQILDRPDVAECLEKFNVTAISWQVPPAASICLRAEAENFVACTVSFLESLPSPRILTPSFLPLTRPAWRSAASSTVAPLSKRSRSERFTTA